MTQLADRAVERSYLTLVHGAFEMKRGTIEAPIGRDPTAPDADGGASARAARHAPTTASPRPSRTGMMSLLDVELETGRTHQIRVHLASIGHPVVGDVMYRRFPAVIDIPRMFLHAARLVFTHPVSHEIIDVEAPLPDDLVEILEQLRSPRSNCLRPVDPVTFAGLARVGPYTGSP